MRRLESEICLERVTRTEKLWSNLVNINSSSHEQTGGTAFYEN